MEDGTRSYKVTEYFSSSERATRAVVGIIFTWFGVEFTRAAIHVLATGIVGKDINMVDGEVVETK